ncbi:MAG: hypothetical protein COY40_03905 [Alphaproteobacteria bacterium CG_4_10_14_0_8_um_filter_53_9]|nr:MAG: hypothetical protein COY40_03905 [Alphaproteobacteria bacterium CG_4_10_14_0_8_um_filter_53_9]
MALPPLRPTPHLTPLLAPEEEIIYTAQLHPLHGIGWLAFAVLFFAMMRLHLVFLLPCAVCVSIYLIPFKTNEVAVTTHRLLLRMGRFRLAYNDIEPDDLNHWQFYQNPITNVLGGGAIILNLDKGAEVIPLRMPHLRHPLKFIEALGTLNPAFRGGRR